MSAATPEHANARMSIEEMNSFIRNHFEEFVNQKNIAIGDVNFASDFVGHGGDGPPGTPPGPEGAKQYAGHALKKSPDRKVTIEDMIAAGDKVVVEERLGDAPAMPKRMARERFTGVSTGLRKTGKNR